MKVTIEYNDVFEAVQEGNIGLADLLDLLKVWERRQREHGYSTVAFRQKLAELKATEDEIRFEPEASKR